MLAYRLRYWLAVGLLLLVASCLDERAATIPQTETPPTAAVAAPGGSTAMPATLRMAFLRTQQKAAGYDFTPDGAGTLRSRAGAARVVATPQGVRLSRDDDGGFALGVETRSVGRDGAAGSGAVVGRRAEGQELVIDREDDVEERYLAGPLGLEQGWVLGTRPEGGGPLTIEVAFDGLAPELAEGAADRVLLRDEGGLVRAGYRDLVAADAEGRELSARMEVRGGEVALVIDDAGASYPVRVDPLMWTQQAELIASDEGGDDLFGGSVSVSGGTAIVGARQHQVGANALQGAAYVFVQSGATWSQQAELIASDGAADDRFGFSVSVSGGTAIVGAPAHPVGANSQQGAAYVFVQSGTTWSQQAELIASDSAQEDEFGFAVSVSGGTALVGAPYHQVGANAQQGAAYVFVQSGTTWSQQAELTASDGAQYDSVGHSVSVSGVIIVVGTPYHQVGANSHQGAAYVFVQSGTTWSQQAELTASDGAVGDQFGYSVSVSGDTAIVGAPGCGLSDNPCPNPGAGAAYVFAQSGTTWSQQAELIASDGAANDDFGFSVSVSGGTAVVGADGHQDDQGAAYVFVQSGVAWSQQAELTASDGAAGNHFGSSVSMSGGTALIGTPNHGAYVVVLGVANGMPCTGNAQCMSGVCGIAGTGNCCAAACSTSDPTCGATACDSTGACVFPTTPCDDGDPCTANDTCQAGVCTSGGPAPDGTPCTGGTCQAGVCTAAPDAGGTGGASSTSSSGGAGGTPSTSTSSGTGAASSSSTGGAGASGGTSPTGASSSSASSSSSSGGTGSVFGGCGCRAAGHEGVPGVPAAVLVLGALAIRRRRRGPATRGAARPA